MKSPNTDPWFFTCESLINKHYIEMVSVLVFVWKRDFSFSFLF